VVANPAMPVTLSPCGAGGRATLISPKRVEEGRMPEPTLYERLGGVYAISAVVDYFSDQLLERDTIEGENQYIRTGTRRRPHIGCGVSSSFGPCGSARSPAAHFNTPCLPLGDAHFEFQLKPVEFDQVAAVLSDSLDHFNVPAGEKEEVLAAFAAFKPAITAGSILR
jgi:hemoglobin